MNRENIKIGHKETKTSQQQKARFSSLYLNLRKAAVEPHTPIKAKLLQLYRDCADWPHGFDCAQIGERQTESQADPHTLGIKCLCTHSNTHTSAFSVTYCICCRLQSYNILKQILVNLANHLFYNDVLFFNYVYLNLNTEKNICSYVFLCISAENTVKLSSKVDQEVFM